MGMWRRGIVLFALTLGASSCQSTSEPALTDWPEIAFGSDVVWVARDSVGTWSVDPLLDGDRVYYLRSPRFGISDQIESPRVVAVGTTTGDREWSTNVAFARNFALAGFFVASAGPSLQILDRLTGSPHANHPLGSAEYGLRITADGSRFYALTFSTGRVIAYDPVAKAVAWETPVGVTTTNSAVGPVVTGDRVIALFRYIGTPSDSTIVAALDRNTGAMLWRFAMGGSYPSSAPVVLGDRVFVVTQAHDVIALSLTTGTTLWQADARDGLGALVMDGITACDGRVMVATGSGKVMALNAQSGGVLWTSERVRLGSNMMLQCLHGTVLAYIGELRILRATDGSAIASYPLREFTAFINGATRDASYLYLAAGRGLVKIKAPSPSRVP